MQLTIVILAGVLVLLGLVALRLLYVVCFRLTEIRGTLHHSLLELQAQTGLLAKQEKRHEEACKKAEEELLNSRPEVVPARTRVPLRKGDMVSWADKYAEEQVKRLQLENIALKRQIDQLRPEDPQKTPPVGTDIPK